MKKSWSRTSLWVVLGALLAVGACGDDGTDVVRGADDEVPRDEPRRTDASTRDAGANAAMDAALPRRDAGALDASSSDPAGARAEWLIESGDSVFFVGNSFFNYDDHVLPDWVRAVGQAVEPKVVINTGSHIVPGNHPLSWFYEQPESQIAIASKQHKLFVLQGEEFEPVEDKAGFHNAVRDYYHAISAQGGSVVLFMTWDFKWNEGDSSAFLGKLAAAYDEIGKELDIPVIPVGLIYDDVNKAPPSGEEPYFLTGGDLHQTEKGSVVNAYATFAMLTGIDPQGIAFSANGNTSSSPALLQYLSDKSWARVAPRLAP